MPDYNNTISSIINNYKEYAMGYRDFLLHNIEIIQDLFKESKTENLRSLKSLLLDFERVYSTWIKTDVSQNYLPKVLYMFGAMLFTAKAGDYEEDEKYIRKHIDRDTNEIITSDKGIYRMKCTSGFNDNAVGIQFVPTLRARNSSTIALQTYDTLQGKKYYIKRLTPLEAFRFMGFSDEDYLAAAKVNCKTQLYKQCGNSIVVNVVEEVLRALFKAMPKLFEDVQIIDLFAGIGAFEKAFKKVIDDANDRYIVPVVSDTDKFIDDYNNSIFNGDCIEIMKSMNADSVSMTLTDIPYAECKKDSNGLRVIDKKNANTETFDLLTFIKEVDRVTQGIIVIFCGMEQYSTIFKYFAQKQNKHLGTVRGICWAKTNPSPMNGQNIYLSGMELAVWYKPKGVKFNGYCKSNVFMFPCGKSKLHPTEKNYKLITELILDNTQTGDVVFDPCCGSGTHLLCAKENNRQYVGIELDADYYKIAQKRLL